MASYEQRCRCDGKGDCWTCGGRGVVCGNGSATGGFGAWLTVTLLDPTAAALLGQHAAKVVIKKRGGLRRG